MPTQTFANHAHRPTPTVIATFFVVVAAIGFVFRARATGGALAGPMVVVGLLGALMTLIYLTRVYTTRLQDRIIRLEMRIRCAGLLTPEQQRTLAELDMPRVAALRFASDPELPALLDRAVRESLKADDIKRAVKTWVPDLHRT